MLDQAGLFKIFEMLPTPAMVLSGNAPAYTIVAANNAYERVLKNISLQDQSFLTFFNDRDNGLLIALMECIRKKELKHVSAFRSNTTGESRYFNADFQPIVNAEKQVDYILHTLTDVTAEVTARRKEEHTSKRLHETTLLMLQGQELANFGNWSWDVANNIVTWSDSLYQIYGLDRNSFKATFEGYQERLHPDDRERVIALITGVLQSKNDVVFEERIIRPNGELRYLRSWGRVQTDTQGNPVKMIGACLDVTESKHAESRLSQMHTELELHVKSVAESEKKYSDLFHFSPLPMWVVDLDSKTFLDVNTSAIKHYGYSRDEFLHMSANQLWADEDMSGFIKGLFNSKKVHKIFDKYKRKDGEVLTVSIQSSLIEVDGQNTCLLVANDITERQNHLAEVESMNKQLREIAWIQSHVVRAPLARLMGLVEVFKSYKTADVDTEQLAENIRLSANELDEIIKSISDKTDEVLMTTKV